MYAFGCHPIPPESMHMLSCFFFLQVVLHFPWYYNYVINNCLILYISIVVDGVINLPLKKLIYSIWTNWSLVIRWWWIFKFNMKIIKPDRTTQDLLPKKKKKIHRWDTVKQKDCSKMFFFIANKQTQKLVTSLKVFKFPKWQAYCTYLQMIFCAPEHFLIISCFY